MPDKYPSTRLTGRVTGTGFLKPLIDHQARVIERPQYQCATCEQFFPSDKIKLLCRWEGGERFDVYVCREHMDEWLDQGGWRG